MEVSTLTVENMTEADKMKVLSTIETGRIINELRERFRAKEQKLDEIKKILKEKELPGK